MTDIAGAETITDLEDVECPFCKRMVWKAKHMGSQVPFPGALAFCKGCGSVSIFTDRTSKRRGLALRKPDVLDDLAGIDRNRQVQYWKACYFQRKN